MQLRHTYLRVLHPLLNNTQFRTNPYKPLLVKHTLQSIISHAHIRDINPTTRRLVERCLSGEWSKSMPSVPKLDTSLSTTVDTDDPDASPLVSTHPITFASKARSVAAGELSQSMFHHPPGNGDKKHRPLGRSASAEILKLTAPVVEPPVPDAALSRRPSKSRFRAGPSALNTGLSSLSIVTNNLTAGNDSPTSLASLAGATPVDPRPPPRSAPSLAPQFHQRRLSRSLKSHRMEPQSPTASDSGYPLPANIMSPRANPLTSPSGDNALSVNPPIVAPPTNGSGSVGGRGARAKPPPPPPPKRRRPPQTPIHENGSSGERIQTIASSAPSTLSNQKTRSESQRSS